MTLKKAIIVSISLIVCLISNAQDSTSYRNRISTYLMVRKLTINDQALSIHHFRATKPALSVEFQRTRPKGFHRHRLQYYSPFLKSTRTESELKAIHGGYDYHYYRFLEIPGLERTNVALGVGYNLFVMYRRYDFFLSQNEYSGDLYQALQTGLIISNRIKANSSLSVELLGSPIALTLSRGYNPKEKLDGWIDGSPEVSIRSIGGFRNFGMQTQYSVNPTSNVNVAFGYRVDFYHLDLDIPIQTLMQSYFMQLNINF